MRHGAFIDGQWQAGNDTWYEKTCPATGATVWEGQAADREQVGAAISSAQRAGRTWGTLPLSERRTIIEAYGAALGARVDQIAEAISRDMGKPLWESRAEAATMQAKIAVSIRAQDERAGNRSGDADFGTLQLTHRPHGVMAVLGPFNFPGHLPNGHIVPALLAGNTCVFKPSELAPTVAEVMIDAFQDAGLPPGVVNVVQGGRTVGTALLEGEINGVLFTGSASTGLAIHRMFAGRPDVILALELGGNNPLILWSPADIDAAADIAAQSAFLTTGQRCSCARRIILPKGRWGDQVVDAIADRARELRIGAWDEDDVFMGPLVSSEAAENAVAFQMALARSGGRVVRRLKRMARGDAFVTAGVIDVSEARSVPDEELFGPFLQIYRVDDFDTALVRANDTRYGLAGGLVCDDEELWERAQQNMRVGILNRNRPTVGASGSFPFGGPGLSGNFRPGAFYAADYCAWPQASQIRSKAGRLSAVGFPK